MRRLEQFVTVLTMKIDLPVCDAVYSGEVRFADMCWIYQVQF